jgi:Stage II sporulation protein E (SpoIIE)
MRFRRLTGTRPGGAPTALFVGALAVLVAVPVADLFLPSEIHVAPILAVAPAFTAMFAGHRTTAVTGVLAVAALVAAGAERGTLGTEPVILQIGSLAALCVLLVVFCHLRERLERVRSVYDVTRRAVLPPLPERVGPVTIATEYRAAEDESRIGGDLYGVARTDDCTRVVIGDVRGKGLASVSDTAITLGAFRAETHRQSPLAELVSHLEGSVGQGFAECPGTQAAGGDERFVTAVVAEIPDDEPVVRLISCGHPPPLLLRRGTATPLDVPDPAPPLGLGRLSEAGYTPATFPFGPGDLLLLYTDGVTEARDRRRDFYPLAERAAAWTGGGPALLIDSLVEDLLAYTHGSLDDDLAVIALQRTGPTARTGPSGA